MTTRKVILITTRAISAARLSRRIAALPGYEIAGLAPDLSSAYMLTEGSEPGLALIGPELARQPEFEGLLSMFRVTGTSWLEIPEALPPPGPGQSAEDGLAAWLDTAQSLPPVPGRAAGGGARAQAGGGFLPDRLILIGASTGGIDALMTILPAFPADCPPTAIVQHTGAAFSDSLIRLFARCTAARVIPAAHGTPLEPGTIMVGAGSAGHLRLAAGRPLRSELAPGAPVSGHLPSVDMLFRSAVPMGQSVAAALLTGMGRDGAQGLLELRAAGAMTLAQDEASSVVYGMPRAAAELGAAGRSLPLNRIAGELLGYCQRRPGVTGGRG